MLMNKIIKSTYHTFAMIILLFVAILLIKHQCIINKRLNLFTAIALILIAIFHAYDVWWFYNKEGPAPI